MPTPNVSHKLESHSSELTETPAPVDSQMPDSPSKVKIKTKPANPFDVDLWHYLNNNSNYYDVLRLSPRATHAEITRAYVKTENALQQLRMETIQKIQGLKALGQTHTEAYQAAEDRLSKVHRRLKHIGIAVDVLSDPIKRAQYDASIGIKEKSPSKPEFTSASSSSSDSVEQVNETLVDSPQHTEEDTEKDEDAETEVNTNTTEPASSVPQQETVCSVAMPFFAREVGFFSRKETTPEVVILLAEQPDNNDDILLFFVLLAVMEQQKRMQAFLTQVCFVELAAANTDVSPHHSDDELMTSPALAC